MPLASNYPFLDVMWTVPLIGALAYMVVRPAEQATLA
jgi:hypothetical protein